MFSKLLFGATLATFLSSHTEELFSQELYKDSTMPVEERIDDLIQSMTLEEKVGQMIQYVAPERLRTSTISNGGEGTDDDATAQYPDLSIREIKDMTRAGVIGSFLQVLTPQEANELQTLASESRLGIPVLLGTDAIHGAALFNGSVVYPTPISLACAFDPQLVRDIARRTAVAVRQSGSHWTFSPNVDIARDPRWGRVGETFGEDPFLVGVLGRAMVYGYQDTNAPKAEQVLACLKHLLGGGLSVNGLNAAPFDVSEHTLRDVFFQPYLDALEANPASVMASHNEVNGIPAHASRYLLQELLRDEGGFDGFVVSDWNDVYRLETLHRIAENPKEAAYATITAGLDMNMHGPGFFEPVMELVREGRISEERIDTSVRRILKYKFQLGLFEKATVAIPTAESLNSQFLTDSQLALKAARETLVLVKNKGDVLPIDTSRHKRIMLTGPLADMDALLGDWVFEQPAKNVITIREGMEAIVPDEADLSYFDVGNKARHIDPTAIAKAAKAGKKSDLIIAVVGDNPLRYQNDDRTSGENFARSDIDLPGNQLDLVKALVATGRPVVVVLIGGRPIGSEWLAENTDALLYAFEPGGQGGRAVAETLYGISNPSGRLPVSIARSAGQIGTYYNHKPSQYFRNYALGETGALYEFGHGLSYTQFDYSNLKAPAEVAIGDDIEFEVTVTNSGSRASEHIVLAYLRDEYASVTRPVKMLKGFERIKLEPKESKRVSMTLPANSLSMLNIDYKRVIEPGSFTLLVENLSTQFEAIAPQ